MELGQLRKSYYLVGVFPRVGWFGRGGGVLYSGWGGLGEGPRTEGQKGEKWAKSEYFGLGAIELLGVRGVFFFIFVGFGVMDVMV
jgi:hypothetical protein